MKKNKLHLEVKTDLAPKSIIFIAQKKMPRMPQNLLPMHFQEEETDFLARSMSLFQTNVLLGSE